MVREEQETSQAALNATSEPAAEEVNVSAIERLPQPLDMDDMGEPTQNEHIDTSAQAAVEETETQMRIEV